MATWVQASILRDAARWPLLRMRTEFRSYSLRRCVEHFAELVPAGAIPALQLHLGPDHIAGRAGVDLDAGQRGRQHEIPQALGLRRDIGARQIVAALF